jgi:hypothetical protein
MSVRVFNAAAFAEDTEFERFVLDRLGTHTECAHLTRRAFTTFEALA